jgi:hypothetical protein
MNKEVVHGILYITVAESGIKTSKFNIPCSLFDIHMLFITILLFSIIILFGCFNALNKD